VGVLLALAQALRYLAVAVAVGLLVLVARVWAPVADGPAGERRRAVDGSLRAAAARTLRFAGVATACAAAAALLLRSARGDGVGVLGGLEPDRIGAALGTAGGLWAALAALAGVVVALRAARLARAADPPGLAALGVALAALPLGGHAADGSPAAATVLAELVHVAAMGTWVGGLAVLALLLPRVVAGTDLGESETAAVVPGTTADGPEPASAEAGSRALRAALLLRFSPVALTAVAALTAAGTLLAVLQLTTLYDLTDTAYGRAIALKAFLLLGAVGLAVLQRELLVPQLRDAAAGTEGARAERAVRAALRGELVLLAAVLVVTGALAGYDPPRTIAPEPVDRAGVQGDVRWRLRVTPARRGANDVVLRLADASGRPLAAARAPRARALPPNRGRAVAVPLRHLGGGRWRASAVPLATRGRWRIAIEVPPTRWHVELAVR